jgi:hypothetical protein
MHRMRAPLVIRYYVIGPDYETGYCRSFGISLTAR